MFKGARPKGQPRSLRTVAEDKATASFPEDLPYVPSAGLPAATTGASQKYSDTSADPAPFVLRG